MSRRADEITAEANKKKKRTGRGLVPQAGRTSIREALGSIAQGAASAGAAFLGPNRPGREGTGTVEQLTAGGAGGADGTAAAGVSLGGDPGATAAQADPTTTTPDQAAPSSSIRLGSLGPSVPAVQSTVVPSVFNTSGQNVEAFQAPATLDAQQATDARSLGAQESAIFRDPTTITVGELPGELPLAATSERLGGGRTRFNFPQGGVTVQTPEAAARLAQGRAARGLGVSSFNVDNFVSSARLDNARAAVETLRNQGASAAAQAEAFGRISRGGGRDLSLEGRADRVRDDIASGRVRRDEGEAELARIGRDVTERDLSTRQTDIAEETAGSTSGARTRARDTADIQAETSRGQLNLATARFQNATIDKKNEIRRNTVKDINTIFSSDTADFSSPAAVARSLGLEETIGSNGIITLNANRVTGPALREIAGLKRSGASPAELSQRLDALATAARRAGFTNIQTTDDLITMLSNG